VLVGSRALDVIGESFGKPGGHCRSLFSHVRRKPTVTVIAQGPFLAPIRSGLPGGDTGEGRSGRPEHAHKARRRLREAAGPFRCVINSYSDFKYRAISGSTSGRLKRDRKRRASTSGLSNDRPGPLGTRPASCPSFSGHRVGPGADRWLGHLQRTGCFPFILGLTALKIGRSGGGTHYAVSF
jgi:hypothetical protein